MRIDRPKETLDPNAKKVWQINGLITFFIFILISIAFFIARYFVFEAPMFIGFILIGVSVFIAFLQIIIIPPIRMIYWGYEIKDEEIDIQYGIFVIKRSLIPMQRIQHVDTEHGPIMRLFNLATLSVSTAGTTHKIPALQYETAVTLRKQISKLAQVSEEDV